MTLAAVLLLVADPAGDVRGNGAYRLPSALLSGAERSIDIREFRAENVSGKLRLTVGLGGTDNPWNAPSGFSAVMLDVFVKTDFGGQKELADTGFNVPPGSGWQYHFQVTGFGARAWQAGKDGQVQASSAVPGVRLDGTAVVMDTNLPAGRYSYWVTSRVYSPLTQGGFLPAKVGGDEASLGVDQGGMPSAVDVLYAGEQSRTYTDRVLPASGELRDRRPLMLLLFAGVGLLVAIFSTFRAWRKQP